MRMNLVKDGLYEREYYFGRKGNKGRSTRSIKIRIETSYLLVQQ